MCKECGCDHGGDVRIDGCPVEPREHGHSHEEGHTHAEDVHMPILDENARVAERNRGYFEAKNVWVLNVLSSPGSGKTTLLAETARRLKAQGEEVGMIVGDLATDNDAVRLREAGIPVVQITTGTMCHLDASMVARAARQMDLDALDILIIENVGNLVCPADFDLGEHARAVLLSTTEGEDKPLKYPPMFHMADIVVITKTDLAGPAGFDRTAALANLNRIAHHADILEVSARTGDGIDTWCDVLRHLRTRGYAGDGHHHH